MSTSHRYPVTITWTGNLGTGTTGYKHYSRDFALTADAKPALAGTADTHFHGTPGRWNPEDLLVGALSACHQLSYLHLCAVNGVVVTAYTDAAEGTMRFDPETSGGHFEQVLLQPQVTISADSDPEKALALHAEAHRICFIASSVNFPVLCQPSVLQDEATPVPAGAAAHGR